MTYLNIAHDGRLDEGMARQQDLLRTAESDGATQLGWKAGFGTIAWRSTLGIDAPLVGFLLDRTLIPAGSAVPIGTWVAPRAEAEVALRLGTDVPGDASDDQALGAVEALAPAIEVVDLAFAPEHLRDVLGGNVYHRRWATGTFTPAPGGSGLADLVGRVTATGEAEQIVTDVQATTGRAGEVLAEVARMATRHGRGLHAGDVVILGAIAPPVVIAPGGTFHYALRDHAPIEVTFTD